MAIIYYYHHHHLLHCSCYQSDTQQYKDPPDGPGEGLDDGEGGDVMRLVESPVVRGKGPRQSDVAESHHEVHEPEPHEELEGLQCEDVATVVGMF